MTDALPFALIAFSAAFAACLTMYSGFGLGTLMLPVFALYFPVEVAVVATAGVHGANNAFKVILLGRDADWQVVFRFGLPAIVAALVGAWLLGQISEWSTGATASQSAVAGATPVKTLIGVLMVAFALFELLPRFRGLAFDRKFLPLGGVLSGFFGGLSGHQGALRSAFLAKSGLDTRHFVGSNAVIGFGVDLSRIAVYLALISGARMSGEFAAWPLVVTGSLAAFAGVLFGRRYLEKVTMNWIQLLVAVLLLGVGCGLILGLI